MQNGQMTGFVAAVFALVAAGGAPAQQAGNSWKPDGNVEFVVGAGAGGENDRIARAIQHVLTNGRLVESMTVLNNETESNIDLLDLVSTPAAADWDASFTVKRINL